MNCIFKNVIEKENGEKLTVSYYLTFSDNGSTPGEYGIAVKISENGDTCQIDHISPRKQYVENLLELCFKNLVTPTSLNDIVYDYLCE